METQTFRDWTLQWDEDNPKEVRVWKGSEDLGFIAKEVLLDLHFLTCECFSTDCQCDCYEAGFQRAQEAVGEWNERPGY